MSGLFFRESISNGFRPRVWLSLGRGSLLYFSAATPKS